MEQYIVFATILFALYLFVDGRIRYDFVGLMALLFLTVMGIVNPSEAFLGFGHPAVVSVAAILVVSAALIKTGVLDYVVDLLNKRQGSLTVLILWLTMITAILSSFMNNVGALALIMPIAIKIAQKRNFSVSYLLMPIAFASLLGGLATEIGTPPNLIISTYRSEVIGEPYAFFDFAPVGVGLILVGVLFIALLGWHLIPCRKKAEKYSDLFKVEDYLVELEVLNDSKIVGRPLKDFMIKYQIEINVLSILRNGRKMIAPLGSERLIEGDILVVKMDHNELSKLMDKTKIKLKGSKLSHDESGKLLNNDDYALVEVVLRDDSPIVGRTAFEVQLRNRYGVNLVAVSRKGHSSIHRLKAFRFSSGDILLIQVPLADIKETYLKLKCLPLAERGVNIDSSNGALNRFLTLSLFATGIILTTLGVLPVQISFSIVAVALVLLGILTKREFYDAIEWPIIIMLGALLPVGSALESTGGADTIASLMMNFSNVLPPAMMMVLLMIITMVLTNLINNAAAAVLMAPIAYNLSLQMGINPDPLLMSVAIASSSAFLTPIGHQSNTLVMGPGGYRFGDYWKLGLPVSIVVLIISTPLILYVWPM